MRDTERLKQSARGADCSADTSRTKCVGFFSRGNTAIAALVMITLIGAGAMVLDATRGSGVQSQAAAAAETMPPKPTDKGSCVVFNGRWLCEKDESSVSPATTCELGFDLSIKIEKGKPIGGKRGLPVKGQPDASRCGATENPNEAKALKTNKDLTPSVRSCTPATSWYCRVWYCKPQEMLLKDKEGNVTPRENEVGGCVPLPRTPLKVGEKLDVEGGDVKEGIGGITETDLNDIAKSSMSPDAKIKASITAGTLLPDGLSTALADAYQDEAEAARIAAEDAAVKVAAAEERLKAADAKLTELSCNRVLNFPGSSCYGAQGEYNRAEAAFNVAQREQQELAIAAQNLRESEKALEIADSQAAKAVADSEFNKQLKGKCPFGSPDVGCGPDYKELRDSNSTFSYNCPGGPGCPGGEWDPKKGTLVDKGSGSGGDGSGGNRPPPSSSRSGSGSNFGLGQIMPLLGGLLGGFLQSQKVPSCKITASPTSIAQTGQPVTLSWSTENAQSASLSSFGQVGPSGSMTVNPQQTTTYTMQVIGFPPQQTQQQQQQTYNPYNPGAQQQGRYVWEPSIGAYVYVPGTPVQQQQANPYGQIGQQVGQLFGGGGGQQQAKCEVQVKVGADANQGGDTPKAQISCQPRVADVGMQIAISFACQNAATAGGSGFSTNGNLSGSATAVVPAPTLGSSKVTYGLTCSNQGKTDSAECTIDVQRSSLVMVANPKNISSGESANIGWISKGMERCTLSSPTLPQFTDEQSTLTQVSGVVKTPALSQHTKFVLTCTTLSGATKTAETTVEVGNTP